jgi:hypothetical protein
MTATTVGQTTFANNPSTTIATNGYNGGSATGDAPSAGTSESWTVTSSGSFPAASSSATPTTGFHIADPAAMAEGTALGARKDQERRACCDRGRRRPDPAPDRALRR